MKNIKNNSIIKNTEFDWLGYCVSCNVDCCHTLDSSIPENECIRQGTENVYDSSNRYIINNDNYHILNNESENKSEINESYDNRPLECRLFPFDVMKIDEKLVWVKKNDCHATPRLDYEKFMNFFERQFSKKWSLENIKQYVEHHKITKPEKYEANNFTIIREINWPNR